jgi:hypothetical protein
MRLRCKCSARNPQWLTLAVLLAAGAIAAQAGSLFISGADPSDTNTTFSDTNNGVMATFSSSADPGGFQTQLGTVFNSWSGETLLDPGTAGAFNIALDIVFSTQLDSVSMNFAVNSLGTSTPFVLTAYLGGLGGTVVGSQNVSAALNPTDNVPEGIISFNSAVFDTVVLTAPDATNFGIGNVDVQLFDPGVPEPSTLFSTLVGAGLLAGIAFLKRRHGPRSNAASFCSP